MAGEASAVELSDVASEQIQVMILGTYHMGTAGAHDVAVDGDDVLSADRQAELTRLCELLDPWHPDRIAVELPYDEHEPLNTHYEAYRSGDQAYDEPARLESPDSEGDEPLIECRNEVVQIGFRLAERCGHEEVYPIDSPAMLGNDDLEALRERGYGPEQKTETDLPSPERIEQREHRLFANSAIVEYHRVKHQPEELQINHTCMFGEYLRLGSDDNFGGPDALATWYKRNLRMVHNVWRAVEPGDERVFVLVGTGHVRILRRLFGEMPQFDPVSPLPYLETA